MNLNCEREAGRCGALGSSSCVYVYRERVFFFLSSSFLPFFLPEWTGAMNVVITIPSEQWDEKAVDVL